MTPRELEGVIAEWTKRWDAFCQWIVDEYGPKLKDWEPAPGRH
jgi:adenosine deaminase CECR1